MSAIRSLLESQSSLQAKREQWLKAMVRPVAHDAVRAFWATLDSGSDSEANAWGDVWGDLSNSESRGLTIFQAENRKK